MTAIKAFCKYHPQSAFWIAALLTLLLILLVLAIAMQIMMREKSNGTAVQVRSHLPFIRPIVGLKSLVVWLWHSPKALPQLLIEPDTNSFSLSRFQFMLWTAVSIYAYTYLWVAHIFVQQCPGLPDYSQHFPWEVLLSAGTTVASQASKGVVGTKGGGPIRPQLSDLISAGGSVAPGRVQFFSWTLVSIAAYLSSVLTTDPTTVHLLPDVPNGLLSISGISAGAYLSARAVSSPGPTLSLAKFADRADPATLAIIAKASDPRLYQDQQGILVVVGSYLSPSAKIMLYAVTGAAADDAAVGRKAVAGFNYVTKMITDPSDVQPNSGTLYRRIVIAILNYGTPLADQEHYELRVQNPDGKYAEVEVVPAPVAAMDSPSPASRVRG